MMTMKKQIEIGLAKVSADMKIQFGLTSAEREIVVLLPDSMNDWSPEGFSMNQTPSAHP
jgi:hypothetical protein